MIGRDMRARSGLADQKHLYFEGSHKSTLAELTAWTQWADKVLVF